MILEDSTVYSLESSLESTTESTVHSLNCMIRLQMASAPRFFIALVVRKEDRNEEDPRSGRSELQSGAADEPNNPGTTKSKIPLPTAGIQFTPDGIGIGLTPLDLFFIMAVTEQDGIFRND